MLGLRNFPVPKKKRIRVGGVSRFSVENFLPHNDEELRRGIL